jgi:hypothetical protein
MVLHLVGSKSVYWLLLYSSCAASPCRKNCGQAHRDAESEKVKFEIYVVDSPKGWTTHRPVSLGIELPSLNGNQFEKRWGSPVTSL